MAQINKQYLGDDGSSYSQQSFELAVSNETKSNKENNPVKIPRSIIEKYQQVSGAGYVL